MKIRITYSVDGDSPTDILIEGHDPAKLYRTAQSALSTMEWACLDRIRAALSAEFLPGTGDARHK